MYAKCGVLDKAEEVFESLPFREVVCWNSLIFGYAQNGLGDEARCCIKLMLEQGVAPNVRTYTSILKGCSHRGLIKTGEDVHMEVCKRGLFGKDILLSNTLVDMYAKFSLLTKAKQVFDELPERNVVSWNSLISGYVQNGLNHEALSYFEKMQDNKAINPNAITYVCMLKACGSIGSLKMGEEIHVEVNRRGLLQRDVVLGTALVDMYAKCGMLEKAQEVFEDLPNRNVVTWSALIAGYTRHNLGDEALKCFRRMQDEGISPNAVTFICILKACGSTASLHIGEEIHAEVRKRGLLGEDKALRNTLVDMYAKCGALAKAQKVLEELPVRAVISWNALISGYGQRGEGLQALYCFERMQKDDVLPNEVTLLSVLNACSHSGLIDEGQMYFDSMTEKYGLVPNLEHYTCMVELFGRAGDFDKAMEVIRKMPSCDYPVIWRTILGACKKWGNVKLGKLAFDQSIQVDNTCASAYVLMAEIFAAAGMREDAQKVEYMRQMHTGVAKAGE